MKNDLFFSSLKALKQIPLKILYLEIMETISNEKFSKSFFMIVKYPFCFKKLKLIIALLLPKFVFKKIKNY